MAEGTLTIRVIFVGNTNVGKTAINTRYLNNTFSADTASTLTPTSSNVSEKTLDGKEVTLQLWDTAGQERFQSLSQVFYRDANIAIICVDGSDQESFSSISLWKSRVLDHEPKCHCVIAVTKSDLCDDQRSQIIQQCQQACNSQSISDYFITSSRTGEGVKEMFGQIATIGEKELRNSSMSVTSANDRNCVNIETKVDKKKKKKAGC
ncbi:Ras-related protein Rab-24 [Tritrichomonas foetus]|uniref:Ras-related protein Rab-24 n=1 Tax=Tritrichomonas foetus TaxID=1144522 RepID=A0A1J4K8L6_9EUKA|nr:Ras-related protein Rab-24 [Tritrichomonas foetus]|eukprot:OHT05773.1 Ras-related protein Rab-24 [Tritrichomonas foetus]